MLLCLHMLRFSSAFVSVCILHNFSIIVSRLLLSVWGLCSVVDIWMSVNSIHLYRRRRRGVLVFISLIDNMLQSSLLALNCGQLIRNIVSDYHGSIHSSVRFGSARQKCQISSLILIIIILVLLVVESIWLKI